jgi:hypothetical protein
MNVATRKKNFLGFGRGGAFSTSRTYRLDRSGSFRQSKAKGKRPKDPEAAYGKYFERLSPEHKAKVRGMMKNPTLSLPRNKFVHARVRMKGGKIQMLVDESLLGHAGASGHVSLNPRKRKAKRRAAAKRRKR